MLTVYFGCMFSEKSGDMLKKCLEAEKYQGKKVKFFKPNIDSRFGSDIIRSRVGLETEAYNLPVNCADLVPEFRGKNTIAGIDLSDVDVVAIDEAQFFSQEIVVLVKDILKKKLDVVVSGLSTDYLGYPIGSIGELILIADNVVHKKAYCSICGEPALFSQRMENGKPCLTSRTGMIAIGDSESYEPRCRKHFVS